MKWFKHDSDASNDAKLKKLRLKYGAQGYGIYWYCLELIARNVEKHNLTFELEHDAELIADDFKLSADLVQHIMTYMVELELFENTDGIVSCLKMATRTDEYTQKLIQSSRKTSDNVPTISVEYPTKSVLIEENRTEDIRLDKKNIYTEDFTIFWTAYPKKTGKDAAYKSWAKAKPRLDDVMYALSWQQDSDQWKRGYIPNPATYLNQGRWKDEEPVEGVPF
jgi:hypothetical protein